MAWTVTTAAFLVYVASRQFTPKIPPQCLPINAALTVNMKFELTYEIEDHGWANAEIKSNEGTHYIYNISYLSDAFLSLSESVLRLLRGSLEEGCAFEHEPGRTKIRFLRKEEEVKLLVYSFEREMLDEPWEKGEVVFQTSVPLKRLKSQFLNQAEKILNTIGKTEYRERWGSEFPYENYEAIKNS